MLRTFSMAVMLALATAAQADETPVVVPWTPQGISSPQFESHPAFDPLSHDFYFVRSSPQFEGWRIMVSTCTASGWSPPRPPDFAGDGLEADPWFTADGRTLYFISSRTTDGVQRKDMDLWRVDRSAQGKWGVPQRLPEPLNSTGQEWFPRLAPDGWLYFGSSRPGGVGKTDIWRAHESSPGRWRVENLGPAINTVGNEYEALMSPDGTRLVVATDDGFYQSRKTASGWTEREKLPPQISANGTEIGALFSPSGKSLLFARDLKNALSGEFLVWRIQGNENGGNESWPPACPSR